MDETQKAALERWYSEPAVLERAKALWDAGECEDLEEYLHREALLPLSRHELLPDYMKNEEGATLFPTNLNPGSHLEIWQEACEIAWQVVEAKLGFTHDDVHLKIRDAQRDDWEAFLKRAAERRGERGP